MFLIQHPGVSKSGSKMDGKSSTSACRLKVENAVGGVEVSVVLESKIEYESSRIRKEKIAADGVQSTNKSR